MEGTDIQTGNVDKDIYHDHSYYGNGCDVQYTPGSTTACSSRITTTFDNEDQKNGTSYNNQAATSGTGASVADDNAIIPNSFCPLGWQLPYGGTGGDYYDKSKSWTVLLNTYNYVSGQQSAREIGKYPLSYVRSGDYDWNVGRVYEMNRNHLSWSSTNKKSTDAYIFNYYGSGYNRTEATYKIAGRTVRCDFDISNLESSPWHPRKTLNI